MIAAGGTAIMLGAAFPATRFIMAETEPATLALVRYVIATACLAAALLATRRTRVAGRDVAPILFLGLLQFGLFHIAYNSGLAIIPASRAALTFSLVTLGTMAIAAAMRYEAVTPAKLAGVGLTLLGVALALGEKAFAEDDVAGAWAGQGLILIAVCCGSIYNVFSRRFLQRYPPLPVTVLAMTGGVAFLVPFAALEGAFQTVPTFSAAGWAVLLFLAIPSGALGFLLWNWALQRTTPTRVAVFLPLAPISATGFGAWLLSEPISVLFLAGLGSVIVGIWLANRPTRRAGPARASPNSRPSRPR